METHNDTLMPFVRAGPGCVPAVSQMRTTLMDINKRENIYPSERQEDLFTIAGTAAAKWSIRSSTLMKGYDGTRSGKRFRVFKSFIRAKRFLRLLKHIITLRFGSDSIPKAPYTHTYTHLHTLTNSYTHLHTLTHTYTH